uniref:Uncharacterized protein n=1 Tax=Arundo donax TaxID=35708 RepID=A0A0A8Z9T9_ARUDO
MLREVLFLLCFLNLDLANGEGLAFGYDFASRNLSLGLIPSCVCKSGWTTVGLSFDQCKV